MIGCILRIGTVRLPQSNDQHENLKGGAPVSRGGPGFAGYHVVGLLAPLGLLGLTVALILTCYRSNLSLIFFAN